MKKILLALLALAPFSAGLLAASERANTVLLHPGETCYAKFAVNGIKLKLLGVTKEKDESAQLTLSLIRDPKKNSFTLKVENRFKLDLDYSGEVRLRKLDKRAVIELPPVVAERLALEEIPLGIDELALFGFKLEK